MPIGFSSQLRHSIRPAGSSTINTSGTFQIPFGVKNVTISGYAGMGNSGNPGLAGNAGNPGSSGLDGSGATSGNLGNPGGAGNPGNAGNPGGAASSPTTSTNTDVASRSIYNVTVGTGNAPGAVTVSWNRQ